MKRILDYNDKKYKIKKLMYRNRKTQLIYKFLRSLKNEGVGMAYKRTKNYFNNNNIVDTSSIPSISYSKMETWHNPNRLLQKGNKRCAIFASYSFDKTIPEYVIYYLNKLRDVCDYIVLVCDNKILESEKSKIIDLVDYAEFGKHGGYDFGSWKKGYNYLLKENLLENFDAMILANDSCYGPIGELENIIDKMETKNVDYWGLLDSIDGNYHIQSFFYYLKKHVVLSRNLKEFFDNLPSKMSFQEAIDNGEKKFTIKLEEKFRSTVYLKDFAKDNSKSYIAGNRNGTVWPLSLLKDGFPLVKVKAMTGAFKSELNESIADTMNYILTKNIVLYEIIKRDLNRRNINIDIDFDENAQDFSRIIEGADVISFDVFDTLLIRPFSNPTDLFEFIEKVENAPGFSEARQIAEKMARKIYPDEIRFDEIYDNIDKKFRYLKDKELEYEFKLLRLNRNIYDLYRQACEKNKIVIATSDMYLPREFLELVLKKENYDKLDKVFVSSENRHTKGNKKLYLDILSYYKIAPSKIVHIGDNIIADKEKPREIGIKSYKIKKITEIFDTPANLKWIQFYKNNERLSSSIHYALISMHRDIEIKLDKSYWNMIGYRLGGPLVLGYLYFCVSIAKKHGIEKLLFVSRDGWSLEKIYSKFFKNQYKIESEYIYLQRIIGLQSLLIWCGQPRYLDKLLTIAKNDLNYIVVHDNYTDNINEFKKYESELKEWSKKQYDEFVKYIYDKAGDNKVAIIDMTTGAFSSYTFAKNILGNNLAFGIFTGTFIQEKYYSYYTYSENIFSANDDPILNISETLLSSPEPNVIGLDNGVPVYDKHKKGIGPQIYNEIYKGIEEYVFDMFKLFGDDVSHVVFTFDDWKNLANNFIVYKNSIDEFAFNKIKHQDLFQKKDTNIL